MRTISKEVTNSILIRADEVDGMVLLRARWETEPDEATRVALMRPDEAENAIRRMRSPSELVSATIPVPKGEWGGGVARATMIRSGVPLGRAHLEREAYVWVKGMHEPVPEGARVVFMNPDNYAHYDQRGALLNSAYRRSVCEDSYDLKALIALSERVGWLTVPDDGFGRKEYYVPGNGYTITVEFDLSPDEYQAAVLGERSWCLVDNVLRIKGEDPEVFRAPAEEQDHSL